MLEYAKLNNIPIMNEEGILFLQKFIKEMEIKYILEIGTAVGYSAIKMAETSSDIKVVSIERNRTRYDVAIKNILEQKLDKQITLINADAFDVNLNEKFDLIFIDAAKAQNQKFFTKFQNNLKPNGYIITDNIYFHGLTANVNGIKNKNLRSLVSKINDYKEFLKNNADFETEFFDIGDGIAVSKKIV